MSDTGEPPEVVCDALTALSFVALIVSGTEVLELYSHVNVAWEQVFTFDGGEENTMGPGCEAEVLDAVLVLVLDTATGLEIVFVIVTIEVSVVIEEEDGDGDGLEGSELDELSLELELLSSSSSSSPTPCLALAGRAIDNIGIEKWRKRICTMVSVSITSDLY